MSLETSFRALVGKNIERMNETIAILYNFSNFCESSKRNVYQVLESYKRKLHFGIWKIYGRFLCSSIFISKEIRKIYVQKFYSELINNK